MSWDEAVESLTRKIGELKSTKRDVWLGLTDSKSGNLFWYNLRDETSFWMTPEDQQQYTARRDQTGDDRATRMLKPSGSMSPNRKKRAKEAAAAITTQNNSNNNINANTTVSGGVVAVAVAVDDLGAEEGN